MYVKEAINKGVGELQGIIGYPLSGVTEINHRSEGEGWQMLVEFIERKSIPDTQDLLGVYEVFLDEVGELTHYERVRVRRRMDLEARIE
jgi:hypothetical protein